ncbi:Flp family type IVb pilin [uncultured Nevskia sp.]|uniref:Flp family type IVb pilin n=1 Tax=uncultured Nevskia sp. TaxID=228950 RepID=UPI0025E0D55D|nr:Flp family type IVb pilin [uncultured Nevskia sp.]
MIKKIQNFLRDDEGASAVEYGLIVGLIAVLLVISLTSVKDGLVNLFDSAAGSLNGAAR